MLFSLLQPLSQIPIVAVDTETSGASASMGHKVIEIGMVRIEAGREVARYEQLFDPGRRVGAGVTALTGISQQMVDGQPRFSERVGEMMDLFRGAAILGHNIRFDLSFLTAEFRRAGVVIADALGRIPIFDTVRIARRQFGRGGNALPLLSRRLGVDPILSHRALADAVTTAAVFEKLLEPVGGYSSALCDVLAHQGGVMDIAKMGGQSLLPLELEEALDGGKPVLMEYVDAQSALTHRVIQPLHVRRRGGELILVAYCQLRSDRRTFKLDRIARLTRIDESTAVLAMATQDECPGPPDVAEAAEVPKPAEATLFDVLAQSDRQSAQPNTTG